MIDTVIIEYLYWAPIFVHYGLAGRTNFICPVSEVTQSPLGPTMDRRTDGAFLAVYTVGLFDCS